MSIVSALYEEDVPFDDKERSKLVRKAANTGAKIESVEGYPILQKLGGVGALLRHRPHWV